MSDPVRAAASVLPVPAPAARPVPGPRVLVAEDETHLGALLEQFLTARGCAVTLVRDGHDAAARLAAEDWDVALTDVQMPGRDGLALLQQARALPLPPEVVVITGNGTSETVAAAMREGAYDYVTKPYRMQEIEALVRRAAEKRLLRRLVAAQALGEPASGDGTIVTDDPALRAVVAGLDARAADDAPVLLVGAPGTGRRTLARRLHAASGRAGPLLVLDAARWPSAPDPACLAAEGTLAVCRAERLPTERLAALRASPRAPRLVLCASAPLPGAGDALALPPLRERACDVPLLVAWRAAQAGAPERAAELSATLAGRDWPGNVAELLAVVDAALAGDAPSADAGPERLEAVERAHVARVLARCGWHQGRAAAVLGISPRTLYRMIRRHGLGRGGVRGD